MKTVTAAVVLGLLVGVLNQAVAEPFNNRGEHLVVTAAAGSDQPYTGAVAPAEGFKNRGEDFIANLPAGSEKPRAQVVMPAGGFNDRG